ncbi:MAG: chromosome segregation protein SMC [Gammaproteobacteria bacterium]|nr:chromosome segregation protein SMC [Gammaproteobacteria bacterium]
MRLKSIKLAGFKSFVDPTTVNFPSNLAAVVGPNGCGKSNIIDAVRWVMGESSAKNLRGENMTDVIFNGSGNRKPVGQASIELIFDNSDNRIKGEYASFAEISIKRKVSRDGTNMYMLNGTKCRRRDITDIFLGTGLGPRSYSIIEQGMVSRLIESKPEELRIFIEEAAGISKYKERRRDTENRIKRTRENMERLTDIRDELTRQLAHLHRQAQAAEKYKEYKTQERDLKAQYDALRWRALDTEVRAKQGVIKELELQIESVIAEQRGLDARHEELLLKHTDLNDELSEVQGRYYSLGGDIARIEQSIEHHIERMKQLRQDLDENRRNFEQSQTEAQADVQKMASLEEELAVLEPELELAEHAQEESAIKLEDAEEQMQGWQQTWDEFSQRSEEPRQLAEVEQSRIQQLEKIVERGVERRGRLRDERQALGENPEQDAIDELSVQITAMEDQLDSKQTRNSELASQIEQERGKGQQLGHELDQARSELQRQKGQFASLDALQKSALGQTDDKLNRWLADKSLDQGSRLGERIKVAAGWEPAVEAVLGDTLQAVCVDDLDSVAGALAELPSGVLALLETGKNGDGGNKNGDGGNTFASESIASVPILSPLSDKITADFDVSPLLQGIYVADSLEEALAARKQLSGADSVVTPQGLWLGRNWIRVRKSVDASEGLLARKGEMSRLSEQMEILQQQADELLESQQASRDALRDLEGEREQVQREIAQVSREYSELKSRLSAKIMKEEQTTQRRQRLQHELEELEKQLEVEQENIARSRENLQNALDAMEQDIERRETLMQQRDSLRGSLDQIRQQARHDKDHAHQLSVREQLLRSQINSMRDTMARMNTQVLRAKERIESIEKQLNESDMPLEGKRMELETLLQNRLEVEDKMNAAKKAADDNEHQLRALEQERAGFERKAGGLREQLMEHRLKTEGDLVKREALSEQLKEARYNLETVLANLPEDLTQQGCEDELEAIGNRVQRLGAINLAAIEEYEQQSERKVYLDAQNDDLERALLTLENAIRKIDRETRTRFKETFDKINAGLQELFPKVFGGGHAYLDMTGEDLLDTGVAIMARPPGKRNSTIHLLSGGEKAMTAIALVFSIFRLNPSPFCMLDEVDAPLDDANVGRYGRLVKEMSDTVQFVFITHNKLTMEIANQLLGVTMHEPGVSRIVAVDIEEAAELAAM